MCNYRIGSIIILLCSSENKYFSQLTIIEIWAPGIIRARNTHITILGPKNYISSQPSIIETVVAENALSWINRAANWKSHYGILYLMNYLVCVSVHQECNYAMSYVAEDIVHGWMYYSGVQYNQEHNIKQVLHVHDPNLMLCSTIIYNHASCFHSSSLLSLIWLKRRPCIPDCVTNKIHNYDKKFYMLTPVSRSM